MAWIELHQAVWTHRKTLVLADELDLDVTYAAAHVIRLWTWAIDNAPEGNLTGFSDRVIAFGAGWQGDAHVLVAALCTAGWLEAQDEHLCIHDWNDYAHLLDRGERHPVRRAWERMAARLRPLIFARDEYRCLQCGATDRLEVDHRLAIARGGTNEWENLQTLCFACNRVKGDR